MNEIKLEQIEMAVNLLKAIAHPSRIAIVQLLEKNKNGFSVKEIHETLGMEQATASHHLGIMKDKGVLISKREGKNTYYFIKNELISKLFNCLGRCIDCDENKINL